MKSVKEQAKIVKKASFAVTGITTEDKNAALLAIADRLIKEKDFILEENGIDLEAGRESGMSEALLDRLSLSEKRIEEMAEGVRQVADLQDPVGELMEEKTLSNGIDIKKIRVPLGVIGIIYEARPNVTVDAVALCLKAGSAVLLRGSSSAYISNKALVTVIHKALADTALPAESVQLIEDIGRESVAEMLKLNRLLDVVIPRGGASLIDYVVNNSAVPVLETGAGICHAFIDQSAKYDMAEAVVINSKTQRPAVCNSIETLLIHKDWSDDYKKNILNALVDKKVELRVCKKCQELLPSLKEASEEDWATEFHDLILSVRIVDNIDEAIIHINTYGTKHSEVIVTEDKRAVSKFSKFVDAAAVYHNASTRFTDGFEFGFGAEIGISTQKLHARGPMGLREITSYKYLLSGDGQIRS